MNSMCWQRLFVGECLLLAFSGCLSRTTVTDTRLASSIVWADAANVPAGTVSTQVHVQVVLDGSTPVAGQVVQLSASNCNVTQPAASTDALGTVQGSLSCPLPIQATIRAFLLLGDVSAPLPRTAAINFYLPADGNTAVASGVPLYAAVNVLDANSNLDTGYAGVVHFSSSDANATVPDDTTLVAADRGSKTLPGGLTLRTAGYQTVTVVDRSTQRTLQSQGYTVGPRAPSLALVAIPDGIAAGQTTTVTVSTLAADASVVTSYHGTVQFLSTAAHATLPDAYTFTASDQGVHTFNTVSFESAGSITLSVKDATGLTGTTNLTVQAGPTAALQLVPPATCDAGAACTVHVRAVDTYGNIAKTYGGTVSFFSPAAQTTLPAPHIFNAADEGSIGVNSVFTVAGVQLLQATDNSAQPLTSQTSVTIQAGDASQLQLASATSSVAGVAQDVTLYAFDVFGNLARSYQGSVVFTGSDAAAAYPGSYTYVLTDAGQRFMPASLVWLTVGAQTLDVVDTANAALHASIAVAVDPAAAASLQMQGPASSVAGQDFNVTLRALDPYGNTATAYEDTVHLSSSDPNAVLPANATFAAADAGFKTLGPVGLINVGNRTLTASDVQNSNVVSSTLTVGVSAGSPNSLTFSGVSSPAVPSQPFNITVQVLDAHGNPASSYAGTVHISSSDPNATLSADVVIPTGSQGTAVINRGAIFNSIGTYTLQLADTANSQLQHSMNVVVRHGCYGYGGSPSTFPTPVVSNIGCQQVNGLESDPNSNPWFYFTYGKPIVRLIHWNGIRWDVMTNSGDANTSMDPNINGLGTGMAMDANGAVTVAYVSGGYPDHLYVERWSGGIGGALANSMTVPGFGSLNSTSNASVSALALDSYGNPYLAWNQGELQMLDYNGTAWGYLGHTQAISSTGVTNTTAAVAVDSNNVPYVVWSDVATGNNDVYVMQYVGGAWMGIGTSMQPGGLSNNTGASIDAVIAVDAMNYPWVAWDDDTTGTTQIYVKQWNGTAWVALAGSASGGGISNTTGASTWPRIRFDSNNSLWVAWVAAVGSNTYAEMLRYNGSAWVEPIAGAATGTGIIPFQVGSGSLAFALDPNNNPLVAGSSCGVSLCTYH